MMVISSLRKMLAQTRRGQERVVMKPTAVDEGKRSSSMENEERTYTTEEEEKGVTTTTCGSSSLLTTTMTDDELLEINSSLEAFAAARNEVKCLELVHQILYFGKAGSECNKKRLVENGTARVIAIAFTAFAASSATTIQDNEEEQERDERYCNGNNQKKKKILEALLSALQWLLHPINAVSDADASVKTQTLLLLGSAPNSLRCILWFLKHGDDDSSKRNAILVFKELIMMLLCLDSHDPTAHQLMIMLQDQEGSSLLDTVLFHLVKDQYNNSIMVSTRPTILIIKPALEIIFHLLNSLDNKELSHTKSMVNMGLIDLLMEVIAANSNSKSNGSRNICEKALGIIDVVCRNCERARRDAHSNALTIPVLVKKILRVSPLATQFSVSILWNLTCKEGNDSNVGVIVSEALRVGAFQKLLLVLQIGCGDATKEQVTHLLKLFNSYRHKDGAADCIESGDFKDLKRRF